MIEFLMSWSRLLPALFFLSACALNGSTVEGEPKERTQSEPQQGDTAPGPSVSSLQDNTDIERLALLWQKRTQEGLATDYPIGPGDILEISVLAMEELKERTVRVSTDGTIFLPLVGNIQANGLTEESLREEIQTRLRRYMHEPRVVLFVKEYHNRQAAVLGAVGKPGLYNLTSRAETILDMISRAGGIAPGADPRIHLIPAEPVENDKVRSIVSALSNSVLSQHPSLLILKRTEPILIDLKDLAYGGYQNYLSLRVRPGDVIMVPGGGQVLVEGWVEKPGAYNVSPGLTAAGVVASAGGPLFPADKGAVKVIRTDRYGGKKSLLVDLEKVKSGQERDIVLQGGDIIEVSSTPGKLIPYGLYRFFSTVVSIGVGGTVPLFR